MASLAGTPGVVETKEGEGGEAEVGEVVGTEAGDECWRYGDRNDVLVQDE